MESWGEPDKSYFSLLRAYYVLGTVHMALYVVVIKINCGCTYHKTQSNPGPGTWEPKGVRVKSCLGARDVIRAAGSSAFLLCHTRLPFLKLPHEPI